VVRTGIIGQDAFTEASTVVVIEDVLVLQKCEVHIGTNSAEKQLPWKQNGSLRAACKGLSNEPPQAIWIE